MDKIAVDIDGVLAKFWPVFLRFLHDQYGINVDLDQLKQRTLDEFLNGEIDMSGVLLDFYQNYNYFENLEVEPRAVEGVEQLSMLGELYVITSRHEIALAKTKIWVERNFPDKFSGVYSTNYGKLCSKSGLYKALECSAIIDDEPRNLLDIVEGTPILINQPWNAQIQTKGRILRVNNLLEAAALLEQKV